jgi:two-component system CheB/CheR fusion protein
MPDSAIATGFVDFAIPVAEMGEKLVQFARGRLDMDALLETSQDNAETQSIREAMPEVYSLLRNQIGHDFSGYKINTFMRRVMRRMQVTQHTKPQEVNALFRDLLINFTNFFRDSGAFETLATSVLPKLFEGRGAGDTVRVWVPKLPLPSNSAYMSASQ